MKWLKSGEYVPPSCCQFGITEAVLGTSLAGLLGGGVLGGLGAGALEGGALGAIGSAITGQNPLTGALTGGLTGGVIGGFGPEIGAATGLGTTGGDVLAGVGAGAVGSALTGGNPLLGAATGGVGGLVSGITGSGGTGNTASPTATVASTPTVGTAGGTSAASSTAGISPGAPGTGGGTPVDLTSSSAFGSDWLTPGQAQTGWNSVAAAGGSPVAPSGGGLSNIGSSVLGLVQKNPGLLLGAGVLGADLLMGNKPLPAESQLQNEATQNEANSRALQSYQQTGTLPPGLQSVVDQQIQAAQGQIVQQYTQLGLGDSTMLTDKLNQLKAQKSAEMAQFASQLAQQGIQLANLSSQEVTALLNSQTQQQDQFTAALGSFAAGLAGLRTGGSTT